MIQHKSEIKRFAIVSHEHFNIFKRLLQEKGNTSLECGQYYFIKVPQIQ